MVNHMKHRNKKFQDIFSPKNKNNARNTTYENLEKCVKILFIVIHSKNKFIGF